MTTFSETRFAVAWDSGSETVGVTKRMVSGFANEFIGIWLSDDGQWVAMHLDTGHALTPLGTDRSRALALGEELLSVSDWGFTALDGWQNRDPEMPQKLKAFMDRHGLMRRRVSDDKRDADLAQQIAEDRGF